MSDFCATGVPTSVAVPSVIGVVGDVHGDGDLIVAAAADVVNAGAEQVHLLGDVALPWTDSEGDWAAVRRVSDGLRELGVHALVTGGNHENYALWRAIRPREDGVRALAHNILLLPRGWRATSPGGRVIASLGGAGSVDRSRRTPRIDWWPDEHITDADLDALGGERVDVLLGHDAPSADALLAFLRRSDGGITDSDLDWAAASRRQFQRAVVATRPQLVVSGHYHRAFDTVQRFESPNGWFETRSVILAADGRENSSAVLWLDLPNGPELTPVSPSSRRLRGWADG